MVEAYYMIAAAVCYPRYVHVCAYIYIRVYTVYKFIDIIVRIHTSYAVCELSVQGIDVTSLSVCMVLTELRVIVLALDFRSVRRSLAWHDATMEGRCGDCGKTLLCHIDSTIDLCQAFSMQPKRHEGAGPCGVR